MDDISEHGARILAAFEAQQDVDASDIEGVDIDNFLWTGLRRLARCSIEPQPSNSIDLIWNRILNVDDPGASFLAVVQALQNDGGDSARSDEKDDYEQENAEAASNPNSEISLESSLILLSLQARYIRRQSASRRITQLVVDARNAIELLHDRLADKEGGSLDADRRATPAALAPIFPRVLAALPALVLCCASACSLLGANQSHEAARAAQVALSTFRGEGGLQVHDRIILACFEDILPATDISTDRPEAGISASGSRSMAKLRHAVAILCLTVGGYFCHAAVRRKLFHAVGLAIDSKLRGDLDDALEQSSNAGESERAPVTESGASVPSTQRNPLIELFRAWLRCCQSAGLDMSSSAPVAPQGDATGVPESLSGLPGSYTLASTVLQARAFSRHSSPSVQRGIGLLACIALGAASPATGVPQAHLAELKPGHLRLARWAAAPAEHTAAEAVRDTGFQSGVSTAVAVGRQWLPLALCLLQESGERSIAGIAAVARWTLGIAPESIYPPTLSVARASADRTSRQRAKSQGTAVELDADILDEELVPESLVTRALLLAATSGGDDSTGALRGLAMAGAQSFLDALAPRPRLVIVRSALHRCPFVPGAAALINVVTRSVARDWNRVAAALAELPPADAPGAAVGLLKRHPFASGEGHFLVQDMAGARLNCLSQEVKGMFAQLQKAMRRSKADTGSGGSAAAVGGEEDEELETAEGTARHAQVLAEQMPVHSACLQSWRLALGLQRRQAIPGVDTVTALGERDFQGGYLSTLRRDVAATIDAAVKHGLMPMPTAAVHSIPSTRPATSGGKSYASGATARTGPERETTERASTLFPVAATSQGMVSDRTVDDGPNAGAARIPRQFAELLLLRHSIEEFLQTMQE